jgi:hypothetical protein
VVVVKYLTAKFDLTLPYDHGHDGPECCIDISILLQLFSKSNEQFWLDTDRHDITEILLNVALNTINQPTNRTFCVESCQESHFYRPILFFTSLSTQLTFKYWYFQTSGTLVVIGTDYAGSCKSNYHTITATSVPYFLLSLKKK